MYPGNISNVVTPGNSHQSSYQSWLEAQVKIKDLEKALQEEIQQREEMKSNWEKETETHRSIRRSSSSFWAMFEDKKKEHKEELDKLKSDMAQRDKELAHEKNIVVTLLEKQRQQEMQLEEKQGQLDATLSSLRGSEEEILKLNAEADKAVDYRKYLEDNIRGMEEKYLEKISELNKVIETKNQELLKVQKEADEEIDFRSAYASLCVELEETKGKLKKAKEDFLGMDMRCQFRDQTFVDHSRESMDASIHAKTKETVTTYEANNVMFGEEEETLAIAEPAMDCPSLEISASESLNIDDGPIFSSSAIQDDLYPGSSGSSNLTNDDTHSVAETNSAVDLESGPLKRKISANYQRSPSISKTQKSKQSQLASKSNSGCNQEQQQTCSSKSLIVCEASAHKSSSSILGYRRPQHYDVTPEGAKEFKCRCNKVYNRRACLMSHISSLEQNIPCPICTKRFLEKDALKTHLEGDHELDDDDCEDFMNY